MRWIVFGVVLYLLASTIQFYFSLYRKHRKAAGVEKVLDAFFYPGFQCVVAIIFGLSKLLGRNK